MSPVQRPIAMAKFRFEPSVLIINRQADFKWRVAAEGLDDPPASCHHLTDHR